MKIQYKNIVVAVLLGRELLYRDRKVCEYQLTAKSHGVSAVSSRQDASWIFNVGLGTPNLATFSWAFGTNPITSTSC